MARSIRINITVDRETLRVADREARRQKTSRSEFIRRAVRNQASSGLHQSRADKERAQRERAIEGLDRLARRFGDWPAEEILRASRDRWRRK